MSNATQQLKAKQRREKFADLLREMFQLNQPELDFGLYRIMHARKDDINRFIEKDLPSVTQKAFSQFSSQDKTQLETELEKARKAAEDAGFSANDSPKVKELQAQLKAGFDLAREEGEVYDALVTFFNRYYSEGDFLSRRVYKDGTYAIPYQGEEVVLHWANKDQYYIKSSETLRDYSFRLNPNAGPGEDPMRVHFKLVDAEAGAKDNNKESADNKRMFVLDAEQPFELIQGEPNDKGETYPELQCRFFYRAATEADWSKKEKAKATDAASKKPPAQDALRAITEERLLGDQATLPEPWKAALAKAYRKADGELAGYSMLAGQLNNYTKKNSFDYFIHKDLGGFLTRELDFYIKNELLDWADIASLKNDPARLGPLLSKIEVIRSLGEKIIAFLAQLENFQKKLWLKKKFVTETNYCITLDRLEGQPELLEEAFENERQLKDWEWLYKIDLKQLARDRKTLTLGELLAKPEYRYMMVDTEYYSEDYKAKLLAGIEGLDQQCDGLLVHSDNFQGLRLLGDTYKNRVECIYIDPPYNSDASSILYKNDYKDSSWMSLMYDRLELSKNLMTDSGIAAVAIDDVEVSNLRRLSASIFPKELGVGVVKVNPQSRKTKGKLSPVHEYILMYGKSSESVPKTIGVNATKLSRYPLEDDKGRYSWMNFIRAGSNDLRVDRPKLYYPIFVDGNNNMRIPDMKWDSLAGEYKLNEDARSDESIVLPVREVNGKQVEKNWQRGPSRVAEDLTEYRARRDRDGAISIDFKTRMDSAAPPTTWWDQGEYASANYGTAEIKELFGESDFDFPKAKKLVEDSIRATLDLKIDRPIVLDYFPGSGTTAEAVMRINRADGTSVRYLLVEVGAHFDSIILPRAKKCVYSKDWKKGAPSICANESSASHSIKYIRLESYEDALGNLALNRTPGQQQLLNEPDESNKSEARQAYVMNYMLEVETRDSQSLLNTRQFVDPTQYKLNVRSASGDETRPVNVDLLETFNYLLGLTVEHIAAPIYFDAELSQGEYGRWQAKVKRSESGQWWFRTVYGTNRAGQQVLVVWRNLPRVIDGTEDGIKLDNAVLDAVLIEKLAIRLTESQDDEVDVLYVNGDHNIAIPRNRKGEPMEQARIQLIEEAFHRLMFADTEQGV